MQNHIGKGKLISVNECVPKAIRDKKRKSDEMAINIQNTYRQLQESYDEDQRHNFNSDDLNNMLQTLEEKAVKCQKDFDYYHKTLSEFYTKLHSPSVKFVLMDLYFNLSNTICIEMRESVDQYLKFLQEAQDPNVYFEKQKQLQQIKQTEPVITKSEKHILGDGSSLPQIGTQEYDESPRHKTIKPTKNYR